VWRGPADAGDPQDKRRVGEDFSGTVVVLLDEQVPPGTDDTLLVHARRSGLDQLVEQLLALRNPPTERQVTSVRVQELVEAERARLDGPFPPLRSSRATGGSTWSTAECAWRRPSRACATSAGSRWPTASWWSPTRP
jgi:hypothetical protein